MSAHHENPHAGQGSVLLDIGGVVGALVVTMPAGRVGDEIEIAAVGGEQAHRPHVAVVRRPVAGDEVPSLVFPELVTGAYDLHEKGEVRAVMRVEIEGGSVTTADWPVRR
ncbi:MAG TPA: hypothetical protein VFO49_13845 [Nocardioides sp.]|nr:hypothetical protein [Nocardioides sp.]